jgi:hypothetical protein
MTGHDFHGNEHDDFTCSRCILERTHRIERRDADRRKAAMAYAEERRVAARRRPAVLALDELAASLVA